MNADIVGLDIETPPAHQRHLAETLAEPKRAANLAEAHSEGLRKLTTAAWVAASNGATWAEIIETVRAGVINAAEVGQNCAVSSATARAVNHDGDDRL
jgi:hypothetical protein